MDSVESPDCTSKRSLRAIAARVLPPLGTPSSARTNGRSVLVPVVVVLALAVGVAVVPAIGAGASVGPSADPGTGVGAATVAEGGTATGPASVQATGPTIDTVGGSSTHVSTVDLSSLDAGGPGNAIVDVVGSLSGESVVLLGAYSRYGEGSPLEHPIRSEIDAIASQLPGVQFADAAGSVDASESTVRYHVRVLEHESHVQTATVWGTQRLYPADVDASDFEVFAAFRDDSRSSILQAIERNEPAPVSALAEDVDRAPSTVSHHLSLLESTELIDRERVGQSVHVTLAPGVRQLLVIEADADDVGVDSTELELVGE